MLSTTSSKTARLFSLPQHGSLSQLIFALLLATIFSHIWLASAPLPWGGPNVILAVAVVFLTLTSMLLSAVRLPPPSALLPTLIKDFRPIIPIVAVSSLVLAWALTVHMFTNTFRPVILGQLALGIALLAPVYLFVDSVRRATLLIWTTVLAVFVSALFGLLILFIGDPFLGIWLDTATVRDSSLWRILSEGRTAGLSSGTISFSYQLAATIPMAFAMLLYQPFKQGKTSRMLFNVALYVMLMVLIMALLTNATRSATLGVLVSTLLIILMTIKVRQIFRRAIFSVLAIAVWLIVCFNPVVNVNTLVSVVNDITKPASTAADAHDRDDLAITGLSAGRDDRTKHRDRPIIKHTFKHLPPWRRYTVQLRAYLLHPRRYGPASSPITAKTHPDTAYSESLALAWHEPNAPAETIGYQFRLQRADIVTEWRPWRDFIPTADNSQQSVSKAVDEQLVAAQMSLYFFDKKVALNPRLWTIAGNRSAQRRIPMMIAAFQYALDFPFGTGKYLPTAFHLAPDTEQQLAAKILSGFWPHNQLLNLLVHYGFLAFILAILFYVLVSSSLVDSGKFILASRDTALSFLLAAIIGSLGAYVITGLMHDEGPFVRDWGHFIQIGLAFSLQRITAAQKAAEEMSQP